jgi:hypothetical protein
MSAPFKTTEYFINNFNQRVSALQGASIHEPKGLGKQVGPGTNRAAWLQNKLNKEGAAALSASVQGIVRKLFRHTKVQTEHRGKVKVTKAIVGFAMHWIRTWDQHKGRIENNLTVSHDPHVTASVLMRMYGPEEARAYEFARLFKQGVRIKHGYVTVHNAIQAGRLKEKNMAAAVFDMKAARLHSFYHKGKTNLMLNQISSTHAQLGVRLQTGFATYIPDILGMNRMERIHQKMLSEDYRLWNTVKVSLGSNWGMTAGPAGQFQNRLRAIQQNALDASSNRQMEEKATWPEKSWLTSMPYMSLLRQG